ncbi:hypothetical protein ACFY6U_12940 [Streptomyces sp. NPDC013157]|uniref:hypothetical protein n=1 Tax=Streptomyces sp. NPDC013157 TaxID=3364861 RepID=UPI0036CC7B19
MEPAKIATLRLSNFQPVGSNSTEIDLDNPTCALGPNDAGKTAIPEALSRLFSPFEAQRKIRFADSHVSVDQSAGDLQAGEPTLRLEVDVDFPEAGADRDHARRCRRTSCAWQLILLTRFRGSMYG